MSLLQGRIRSTYDRFRSLKLSCGCGGETKVGKEDTLDYKGSDAGFKETIHSLEFTLKRQIKDNYTRVIPESYFHEKKTIKN